MRRYALLVAPIVMACSPDTVLEPRTLSPAVRLAVTAGDETPKIMRFQTEFAFAIIDTNTDLIGIAGLPDDLSQSGDCGGPLPYALVDVKQVAVRDEVIHWLVRGHNVNLDVYRLSTFEDVCTSTRLAHGQGVIKYHDNDLIEAGKENTFGWYASGTVALATGGTSGLLEHNLWQLLPTGTFRRIFRQVKLIGQ